MSALEIRQELIEQLQQIAEQKHRSVEEVLEEFIHDYHLEQPEDKAVEQDINPFDALIGIIGPEDTQETHLSVTIKEILRDTVHPQFGFTAKDHHDSD